MMEGTYANPVDFFTPAIIVEIATRSIASLVSLFRPNMSFSIHHTEDWIATVCVWS